MHISDTSFSSFYDDKFFFVTRKNMQHISCRMISDQSSDRDIQDEILSVGTVLILGFSGFSGLRPEVFSEFICYQCILIFGCLEDDRSS